MFPLFNYKVVSMDEVPPGDLRYSYERHRPIILIVHDERLVADCLAAVLSRAGFATLTAYDGKAALELALAVPPELLISDVGIAEINGVHLAMAVVHEVPDCKVLLFSGYEANADLMLAYRAGYDFSSLAKPVHPAEILKQVMACFMAPDVAAGAVQ